MSNLGQALSKTEQQKITGGRAAIQSEPDCDFIHDVCHDVWDSDCEYVECMERYDCYVD